MFSRGQILFRHSQSHYYGDPNLDGKKNVMCSQGSPRDLSIFPGRKAEVGGLVYAGHVQAEQV